MKNQITKIVLNTFALLLFSLFAVAQNPERIDFAKANSNSLVWEQPVPARGTKEFVFYAKKGQELMLNFIDDTNQGSMDWGKVSIESDLEGFQTTIEVSKDYILTVSNNTDKATSFRISISLGDAKKATSIDTKSNNKEEIVRFEKGANSAAITKTIDASGSVDFIINAKKGQKMDFTVGYDFKNSDVECFLTEPNSQDISLTAVPKAPQQFTINKSGNHRLTVNNTTSKKITITLYLEIK